MHARLTDLRRAGISSIIIHWGLHDSATIPLPFLTINPPPYLFLLFPAPLLSTTTAFATTPFYFVFCFLIFWLCFSFLFPAALLNFKLCLCTFIYPF